MLSVFVFVFAPLWRMATAYNPERHYMRGPGPKWREKHAVRAMQTYAPTDERQPASLSR